MCQICQTTTLTENKIIHRDEQQAAYIFNQRTLAQDYRTLITALKPGMRVLDIGCGTGSITKDIASIVGPKGTVIGIDHTNDFIKEAIANWNHIENLSFQAVDLFDFETEEKFDLIVSSRTFQWISTLDKAIDKVKDLLKPNGQVSILDYNHEAIAWEPKIPTSMQHFFHMFLMWRKDAGMNNRIGFDMIDILEEHGFNQVEVFNADEHYQRMFPSHVEKLKIWSKVAASKQIVEDGYLTEDERLTAIDDYNTWVDKDAISMTLKLREVRAILN